MAFKPVITITKVSNDSTFLTIVDATQAYNAITNPTGYGVSYGPAAFANVTSVVILMQLLGENAVQVSTSAISGTINTSLKILSLLNDGVNIVYALYGTLYNDDFVLSNGLGRIKRQF